MVRGESERALLFINMGRASAQPVGGIFERARENVGLLVCARACEVRRAVEEGGARELLGFIAQANESSPGKIYGCLEWR